MMGVSSDSENANIVGNAGKDVAMRDFNSATETEKLLSIMFE